MARKSTITRLAAPVKAAIDEALKGGKATLDEIVEYLRDQYPDERLPSRSALGRYKQRFDELASDLQETREIADIWAQKFGAMPDSDIGKVVLEVLRTLSYRIGADLLSGESDLDAKTLAQLARAMQFIEDAGRLSIAREEKVRKAALEAAADAVTEGAKARGLDANEAEFWRKQVLGVGSA